MTGIDMANKLTLKRANIVKRTIVVSDSSLVFPLFFHYQPKLGGLRGVLATQLGINMYLILYTKKKQTESTRSDTVCAILTVTFNY